MEFVIATWFDAISLYTLHIDSAPNLLRLTHQVTIKVFVRSTLFTLNDESKYMRVA